jgi:hypothetical protein
MNPMNQMIDQAAVLKMQAQLFRKILNIVEKMDNVKKSGYNSHQKYHYSTEQDLVDGVRQLLIDNKIVVLTDSETKEIVKISKPSKDGPKESLVTVVNTRHTFCDVETGYTYNIQSTGTGWDDTDKGSFKAITGAMKYFISKNFLVPGEDDAENDGVTVKTNAPVKTGFNRTAQVTANNSSTTSVVAETPTVVADTSQVAEKRAIPEASPARPGFGRRTQTKTEPNFP